MNEQVECLKRLYLEVSFAKAVSESLWHLMYDAQIDLRKRYAQFMDDEGADLVKDAVSDLQPYEVADQLQREHGVIIGVEDLPADFQQRVELRAAEIMQTLQPQFDKLRTLNDALSQQVDSIAARLKQEIAQKCE